MRHLGANCIISWRGGGRVRLQANKIYEGDCLDLLKDVEDASIDMVLCDLPYGTTMNKWDSIIPLDRLWEQYERIIKPQGVIALSSQGMFTAKLMLSKEKWFKYKFIWVKSKPTNFLNARRQPLRQHEDICIFYKRQPVYRPVMWYADPYDKGRRKAQYTGSYGDFQPVHVRSDGARFPTDALYCKTSESEAGRRVWHPTQKPVALGRYLIRMFTKPGDLVLDNAFGSGSFLVSAAMEGCRYIGIEKNEESRQFKNEPINYMEVARQRLSEVKNMQSEERPVLLSSIEAAGKTTNNGKLKHRGLIDVDKVIGGMVLETGR